jgi:hypothetical protein
MGRNQVGHLMLGNRLTIHKHYIPTFYLPPTYLHAHQPTHLFKCTTQPPTYLNVLPTYLFSFLFIHPPTYLCTYLPTYLPTHLLITYYNLPLTLYNIIL